jgi:hypothetical protein
MKIDACMDVASTAVTTAMSIWSLNRENSVTQNLPQPM